MDAIDRAIDRQDGDVDFSRLVSRLDELEIWPLMTRLNERIARVRSQSDRPLHESWEGRVLELCQAEIYAWEGNIAPLITVWEREYLLNQSSALPLVTELLRAICPNEALVYIDHALTNGPGDDEFELRGLRHEAERMARVDTGEPMFNPCPPLALIDDSPNGPPRPIMTHI